MSGTPEQAEHAAGDGRAEGASDSAGPGNPAQPTRIAGLRPRHLLWLSLLLAPADGLAKLLGGTPMVLFVLSVIALVPLAYLIGEATEHAGEHTGSVIAGLLNASFGNAPELIVALFAVDRALPDVVFGSLTGSVVSNLLLVLGVSTIVARRGVVNRRSSWISLALTALALAMFCLTTALHRSGTVTGVSPRLAVPVCAVLILAYALVTVVSVVGARRRHAESRADVAPPGAEHSGRSGGWSLATALIVLAAATAATALVSEILTGSIKEFADSAGLQQFFVAAVIVAIVGNAAEHGGAVVIARAGKLDLAGEIAFSSSAQVATLVLPLVVLLSLAIEPLSLDFRPVELVTIAASIAVPAALISFRLMTRVSGAALCLTYGGVVAAFYAFS